MNQPTTGSLLEQLRATHVGHRSLADVSVAVEAGARVLAAHWDELSRENQAALIAIVGPVVEAALAALDPGLVLPEHGQAGVDRTCSSCSGVLELRSEASVTARDQPLLVEGPASSYGAASRSRTA